ncbi:acyl-CoA carboxylase subunit epsilon [Streptomyces parvulus]|uniref:acyl-CoA carboxylase subunit epsilon n=1 Tax=Streptomyces parvulus TaxID=146923 RepID=UPI0011C0286D|nr:acyl-CoA carboxylase subunit epsilon [Streptomyces parvulus]
MAEAGVRALSLRIERGGAGELEVAALTAVLCAVLAARRAGAGAGGGQGPPGGLSCRGGPEVQGGEGAASWRRPGRGRAVHRPPHSWQ